MFIENDDDYSPTIRLIEGDYGITLPIELELENGESITNNDSFVINIYDKVDGKKIITKTFSNIQENTLPFQLTEQESQLLPVGKYYYDRSTEKLYSWIVDIQEYKAKLTNMVNTATNWFMKIADMERIQATQDTDLESREKILSRDFRNISR